MFEPKKDAVSFSLSELKRMKDESLVSADTLKALRGKAESMLDKPLYTVTKRKLRAPSGCPNDYMSMGTYWWPDPNTPDGIPYVRRDGHFNPQCNDEHNFGNMVSQVKWCSLAAYYFDDDKYAKRAVDALYTWFICPETYMTPNARYGQAIPGICEGRGIGLIDFRESFEVMNSVRILEAMGKIPDNYVKAIEKWYVDFTDWMLTSECGVDEDTQHNNHGTWYDVQILASAVFTGRHALARKIISTAYQRRFISQIEKTGAQPYELERTQGLSYSIMNHYAHINIAMIAEKAGDKRFWQADPEAGDSLLKLSADYLYPYVKAPDTFPFQQIHKVDNIHLAVFAYYVLSERFPGSHCKDRYTNLLKPDMLFQVMPAK